MLQKLFRTLHGAQRHTDRHRGTDTGIDTDTQQTQTHTHTHTQTDIALPVEHTLAV